MCLQVSISATGIIQYHAVFSRFLGNNSQYQNRSWRVGTCNLPQKRVFGVWRHALRFQGIHSVGYKLQLRWRYYVKRKGTFLHLLFSLPHFHILLLNSQILIYDIIEVVPEPGQPLTKNRFKEIYAKDQKGPVTALSQVKGFLVSAVGQKVIKHINYSECKSHGFMGFFLLLKLQKIVFLMKTIFILKENFLDLISKI